MQQEYKILMIEDSPEDVGLIQHILKEAGISFNSKVVDTKDEFENALTDFIPDIILSDHGLTNFNSLEAFNIVKNAGLNIPFILLSGAVSEEFAVECMKKGIDDYILKSSLIRLPSAIKNIFSKRKITVDKQILESFHNNLQWAYHRILEKNKDITDSISYAKRIQEAMLPQKKVFENLFPKSFIVYKPKNIIGGDFYWVAELNDKLFVAAADCTGHGIPGALLSMLGYTMLNNIVRNRTHISPDQILKNLCIEWKKLFNNLKEQNNNYDGMEISLCSIDYKNNIIEFSGMGGSIIFIRNGKLIEYKGENIGISCCYIKPFNYQDIALSCHKIPFEKGDCIYLFSDGYGDQFGGANNENKFTKKRFKKLIIDVQCHPMDKQKQLIEKAFIDWKGSHMQIDDVFVMGIQL